MPDAIGPQDRPRPWLAWAGLGLAIGWAVLVRVPLILNAKAHLDSDLAVDGLTLLEAARGHWRWHYPGTPHIGTLPVLLSLPQAQIFGAGPITLVSGGAAAYVALVAATFVLSRRAFGPAAALWGLVPLAFASTGTVWLSGRLTGGHVLAAAWHAGAFALLHECLARGGARRAAALGLWCGVGYWSDSMFLITLAGLAAGALIGWLASGRTRPGRRTAPSFALAFLAGLTPYWVGSRVDPHNVYPDQFRPDLRGELLAEHARILGLQCLPRLIAGHRLPGFQADPDPRGPRRPRRLPIEARPKPDRRGDDPRRPDPLRPGPGDPRRPRTAPRGLGGRRRAVGAARVRDGRGARVRDQREHLQLGQLPLPRHPARAVVDRVRPIHARPVAEGWGRAGPRPGSRRRPWLSS